MNFGAIGFVIGHEIAHGFDNTGGQYDQNGRWVEWRHLETNSHYLSNEKCLIEQYGNYSNTESVKVSMVNYVQT